MSHPQQSKRQSLKQRASPPNHSSNELINEENVAKQPQLNHKDSLDSEIYRAHIGQPRLRPSQLAINKRLLSLEGECQIESCCPLKINYPRGILISILLLLSVVGIFVLRYSTKFRKKVFYDQHQTANCTHLYIVGNQKSSQIVEVEHSGGFPLVFYYRKIKYQIPSEGIRPHPVAFKFEESYEETLNNPEYARKGLSDEQAQQSTLQFGTNQHLVEIPNYFEYLFTVLITPFFLLQYFFCFVYFIQGYAPFSIALLFFSVLTATINYLLLYRSYLMIKQIAEKKIEVLVIRNGKQTKINSTEMAPGDIYIPEENTQVTADCLMLDGDLYVNEANLTGESFPIGKYRLNSLQESRNSNVWLYEGSHILQTRNARAIVINTGFTTTRGRIIRRILYREIEDPDFIRSNFFFVLEVVIVSLLVFFATLFILLRENIDGSFKFFKFIDFLASSAPPPLPIFYNLAFSIALVRLRHKLITGTQPQKVVDAAQIKTFCFDKTGTLTKSDVQIRKILKISHADSSELQQMRENDEEWVKDISDGLNSPEHFMFWSLFATCHTTKIINGQILGDEIDREMFIYTGALMLKSPKEEVKFEILTPNEWQREQNLLVLRINQFQSKFQSMSVLVQNVKSQKYFIFVKGAPEKLLQNSVNSHDSRYSRYYNSKVKSLSMQGYRTISLSFKEIRASEVNAMLMIDRIQFEKETKVIGFVAFDNALKGDTAATMRKLIRANIEPKMITGDNIYIAIETARRAGILKGGEKIAVLEGKSQQNYHKEPEKIYSEILAPSKKIKPKEPQPQEQELKAPTSRKFKAKIFQIEQLQPTKSLMSEIQAVTPPSSKKIFPQGASERRITKETDEDNFEQLSTFLKEKQVLIDEEADYIGSSTKYTFAVDNDFITFFHPKFSHSIKVFARIPPQNKALIIRQYKQQDKKDLLANQSGWKNFLRLNRLKIGMCGDGANDLLALREADVSVGIQETDASYGSSFTIKNISDVYEIIKEGKCTQENMIQIYQFYGAITVTILYASVVLVDDVTYFSILELMYLNFGTVLLIPLTLSFSASPLQSEQDPRASRYTPDYNMLSLNNHLYVWGNVVTSLCGIFAGYFYFYNTSQYEPNPKPVASVKTGGFNSKNHSATIVYILVIITIAWNGFLAYRGRPWKQPFYKNIFFTIVIVANMTVALCLAFLTDKTAISKPFQFVQISKSNMGITIGFLAAGLALHTAFNLFLRYMKLDHKVLSRNLQTPSK